MAADVDNIVDKEPKKYYYKQPDKENCELILRYLRSNQVRYEISEWLTKYKYFIEEAVHFLENTF